MMEPTQIRANKRTVSQKAAASALESTMPEQLAQLLRAEREASDPVKLQKAPTPHRLVESWPKPQKPSYGLRYDLRSRRLRSEKTRL